MTAKAEVSQTPNQFASPLKFPALAANNYGLLVGRKMGQQVEMLPKEQPARFRDPNGDYLSRLWAQTTRSTPSFGPWLHGVVKKSMSSEKFTLGKILIVLFLSCWMVLL